MNTRSFLRHLVTPILRLVILALLAFSLQPSSFAYQQTNSGAPFSLDAPIPQPVITPAATSDSQSFLSSAYSYFTSFDTNSTTFTVPYEVFTGVKFQSGINEGALLGGEAQPFKKVPWLTLRDVMTLADTIGTMSENEFDIGAFFVHYDLRFGVFFGTDTIIQKDRWGGIGGLELQKALTKNSFAGVAVERRIDDVDRGALTEFIEGGFTF